MTVYPLRVYPDEVYPLHRFNVYPVYPVYPLAKVNVYPAYPVAKVSVCPVYPVYYDLSGKRRTKTTLKLCFLPESWATADETH